MTQCHLIMSGSLRLPLAAMLCEREEPVAPESACALTSGAASQLYKRLALPASHLANRLVPGRNKRAVMRESGFRKTFYSGTLPYFKSTAMAILTLIRDGNDDGDAGYPYQKEEGTLTDEQHTEEVTGE